MLMRKESRTFGKPSRAYPTAKGFGKALPQSASSKKLVDARTVEDFYAKDKTNINFWLAKMEKYSKENVISSCLRAGVERKIAEEIAAEVDSYVDNRMRMSEVRPLIFAMLQQKNPAAAKKFKAGEIYVRTSGQRFERFNREKIVASLLKETKISQPDAEKIAIEAEKFIRASNLDYISSPLLREMVNVKLIEHGFEEARSDYTRIGMPVFDITELINIGSNENANLQYNPETLHKLVADNVFKEYALMKAIPRHAADAHLHGLVHIHDLDYFVLRPFCFSHDLRYFFKKGYYADGQGIHTAAAGPPKHAEVAILHAAKILASAQTQCGGGQGYNWFNIFLAPFVRGFDYKKMKQMAQMFLFEMSQMYVARGGQTVFSSINLEPSVPKTLENIPAVLPGGIVNGDTYGSYEEEANQLFRAFIDVYTKGDAIGKPFNFPKCEVKVTAKDFDKHREEMDMVSALAAKFGTPYYFIQQDYMPEYACFQCCAYLMPLSEQNTQDDLYNGTTRGGALQVVTINLPRIAYDAEGSDTKMFEILRERMKIARDVLLVKQKIIKQRMQQGVLPFLSQVVDDKGTPYLDVDKQSLEIGMVGLNEMLKVHTGHELHEGDDAWKFGMKVIKAMTDIAKEFSTETGAKFVTSRTPAESCSYRLASIDLKEMNGKAVVQGDRAKKAVYYTNGNHVRPSADVPLFDRLRIEASFNPLLIGGTMSHVWMGEANPDPTALTSLTERIVKKTLMAYYAYTKDLTICKSCKFVAPNMLKVCPHCDSKDVDWYSRITGYYQKVSGWNAGKLQELQDRRRYGVSA